MTLENFPIQEGMITKQLVDRYAEYPGPGHDQPMYYPYDPSSPSQGHIISLPTKQHFGGGAHKNNGAMSALTLLAFLFFLHILQQCLREHMTALITPQIMIMTGGKEGDESIARIPNKKLDKTGLTEEYQKTGLNQGDVTGSDNGDNEKFFTKITSSDHVPWKKFRKENIFRRDISSKFSDFITQTN